MVKDQEQEHVEFVSDKATIYVGGQGPGYEPGSTVILPREHAEALNHLRAKPPVVQKPLAAPQDKSGS